MMTRASLLELAEQPDAPPLGSASGGYLLMDALPTSEHAKSIMTLLACSGCSARDAGLVAYQKLPPAAFLFARCRACGAPIPLFFSTQASLQTAICVAGFPTAREYERHVHHPVCQCGDELDVQQTPAGELSSLVISRCTSCGMFRLLGFRQTPIYYYQFDLKLARELREVNPAVSWVLLVMALEAFLAKALALQSPSGARLDGMAPRVNELEDAILIYEQRFGISLEALAQRDWQTLLDAFALRARIVQNASYDEDMSPFQVQAGHLEAIDETIDHFVHALDFELRKRCVY